MPESADRRLYFLLQRAAHQLRVTADRRLTAAAGVTSAQLGALFAVRERPRITQRELASVLGQRESAITAMVGRLTEAGLLDKDTHPSQHRAVVLELTAAGAATLDLVRPEIAKFNAELRVVLGDEGFDRTAEALRKLVDWQP